MRFSHEERKPDQTNLPSSQRLRHHATLIAKLVLSLEASGYLTIADGVYPNAFPRLKRDASDRFWEIAVKNGYMDTLISLVLPGVRIQDDLNTLGDHDYRAAFICALAAVAASRNQYVAIGDPVDGDIILPAVEAWGQGLDVKPWAELVLRTNVALVRESMRSPSFEDARLLRNGMAWY